MEERIIQIIEKITNFKDLKNNKDIDLIENDILDSLAFIDFITTLEDEFNIEIQPTQIDPNIWRNVNKIAELVAKLQ